MSPLRNFLAVGQYLHAAAFSIVIGFSVLSSAYGQGQWDLNQQEQPSFPRYETRTVSTNWEPEVGDAAPAQEDASDDTVAALTERLDKLEENYGELASSYEELDEAHSSLKKSLKGYAQSGHSGATMKVNGRIHADMWGFPETSPGINGF